jgi:hypothetical protein
MRMSDGSNEGLDWCHSEKKATGYDGANDTRMSIDYNLTREAKNKKMRDMDIRMPSEWAKPSLEMGPRIGTSHFLVVAEFWFAR